MRVSPNQRVVLGPPGTGKTTYLISEIEKLLDKGVSTDKIAFVSFTRKAITEARNRACGKFGLLPTDFPYFQTVHSLCFSRLHCKKEDLMTRDNYSEFGEWIGHTFKGFEEDGDAPLGIKGTQEGDRLLFYDNLCRTMMITPKELWENTDGLDVEYATLQHFSAGYRKYKIHYSLLDFTDLLERDLQPTPVQYVFVDEAQDLSKLQWKVLQHCFCNATVVIAGDDDQSIYKWSGADLQSFLNLEGVKTVLSQSYRVPKQVHACAQNIVHKLSSRFSKEYAATAEEGEVQIVSSLEYMDKPQGSILILARNTYLLPQAYTWLQRNGMAYTGRGGVHSVKPAHARAIRTHNRLLEGESISVHECVSMFEYIKHASYLPKGFKKELGTRIYPQSILELHLPLDMPWWDILTGINPEQREYYRTIDIDSSNSVHADTIHGVKGGEADTVIIISDTSKKTFDELNKNPDDEHRIHYVAVTRAKKQVIILAPTSKYHYPYSLG